MENQQSQSNINWKTVVAVVFVLAVVLAVLGSGWYYLATRNTANQPTTTTQQNETAGWKTYINNEDKFSLNYPPDMIPLDDTALGLEGRPEKIDPKTGEVVAVKLDPRTTGNLIFINSKLKDTYEPGTFHTNPKISQFLSITSRKYDSSYNLYQNVVLDSYNKNKADSRSITPLSKTELAGNVAYTYQMTEARGYNFEGTAISIESKSLEVTSVYKNKTLVQMVYYSPNETIKRMVSTFKFLD